MLVLVKRETGEKPVRTRHCKQSYMEPVRENLKPLETGRWFDMKKL